VNPDLIGNLHHRQRLQRTRPVLEKFLLPIHDAVAMFEIVCCRWWMDLIRNLPLRIFSRM
jgi:hypothetical protein